MQTKDKSFLGEGWAFPPQFSRRNKQVTMVAHEQDIQQSLWILLGTHPGERLMHPTYGCNLRQFVFENLTLTTVTRIREVVERAILFFEPRITVHSIDVEVDDYYEGRVDIRVQYTIRLTNTRTNMVYPFYFREATNAKMDGNK